MRTLLLLPAVLLLARAAGALAAARENGPFASPKAWPSADGRFVVERSAAPGTTCTVTLRRLRPARLLFTHRTIPRYVLACWSPRGSRCVLLDAPDNANSYFWLFRVQKDARVKTERIDYDALADLIERKRPITNPDWQPTRSGVEHMRWISESRLRLDIIYNNLPVTIVVDTASPGSPRYQFVG